MLNTRKQRCNFLSNLRRARPREAARDWLESAFGFDCLGLLGITWDCLEFWTVLPRPAEAGTPNPEEFIARLIPLVVLPCGGLPDLARYFTGENRGDGGYLKSKRCISDFAAGNSQFGRALPPSPWPSPLGRGSRVVACRAVSPCGVDG